MNQKNKAIAAVLLGNFFFGTSVIAVKHITPVFLPPMALTMVRIIVSALLFWSMYAFNPVKIGFEKKDFLRLVLCALAGIALNQSFSIRGMSLTSPIHASLLILTTPIVITFLATWFLKERLNPFKIVGLFLGISGGVLLIFSRDLSMVAGGQQSLGDVFIIIGAISYATYVVSLKPLALKYKANHILQWLFLFGLIIVLPIGWHDLASVQWIKFDLLSWICLGYVILGATFFAYQLMNYSIRVLGASVTGSFSYTQPFFGAIASMLLLNENLSLPKIAAAILIMGGVFLTNYKS
ncbi:MAG: DMT family transporter [Sediminibacterium sp.]